MFIDGYGMLAAIRRKGLVTELVHHGTDQLPHFGLIVHYEDDLFLAFG